MDVVDGELHRWLRFYLDHGGDPAHLTISSDASLTAPMRLYEQFCTAVLEHHFELGLMLPFLTSNPARILKLHDKGMLAEGRDGDVVVLHRGSLEIEAVVARGTIMVHDGELATRENWLTDSDRRLTLHGQKDD
jgi:beta-aspartyl-dipeptidase (metallo-type)